MTYLRNYVAYGPRAPVFLVMGLVFVWGGMAQAQEAAQDAVEKRPRSEFDPVGFELDRLYIDVVGSADPDAPRGPLSSFLVLPKIELELAHTDNLFLTSARETADIVTVVSPEVTIRSDWDNHALIFFADAGIGRHDKTSTEDFEDYKIELKGKLDIDGYSSLNALTRVEHTHEQRGDVDDPGQQFGPTIVDVLKMSVGGEHRVPDGVLIQPSFGVSRYRYENNGSINNADRWRDSYQYRLRFGYEFTPGTTAFVQPDYTAIVYRSQFDRNGLQRDTQLYELLAGITWDASSVTFLEAGIGLLGARFDDPSFSDETRPTAHLELTWNATSLITLNSSIDRTFNPTASAGFAGTIDSKFEASAYWEALYNVILGASYRFRNEEYIDAVPEHVRSTHRVSATAKWLMNANIFARGEISHATRSGDDPFDSYAENQVLVSVGVQL